MELEPEEAAVSPASRAELSCLQEELESLRAWCDGVGCCPSLLPKHVLRIVLLAEASVWVHAVRDCLSCGAAREHKTRRLTVCSRRMTSYERKSSKRYDRFE